MGNRRPAEQVISDAGGSCDPAGPARETAVVAEQGEPGTVASASRVESYIAMALVLLLTTACFVVLRPFLSAVIWAAILSFSTWPIYLRIDALLRGRKTLAAMLTTALAAALLLLPLVALGSHLTDQVTQIAEVVSRWMEEGPSSPPAWVGTIPIIGGRLNAYWQSIANDGAKLSADLRPYVGPARRWVLAIGLGLGAGITELMLSLLISFFLYRDGLAGVQALGAVLGRVAGSEGERLMAVAGSTIKGVVFGIIGTNAIQAVLAMLGLLIAGVPGALFLGFATFFLTVIPLAPAFVFVPSILWLTHQGATVSAIFLGIWYVIVFMVLEGALRAYFIGRGGDLPFILVFLGILGGALTFGLLGIFVGPTFLAVGYALLQDWNGMVRSPDAVMREAR
jgi:predicted PurR-regulated permease PerM